MSHFPEEELVQRMPDPRGQSQGLVHVISAMEACPELPTLA